MSVYVNEFGEFVSDFIPGCTAYVAAPPVESMRKGGTACLSKSTAVRCVETGRCWPSITSAAREILGEEHWKGSVKRMTRAAKGKDEFECFGYHFTKAEMK